MMTERVIVEYVVNEAWQIPLLALGAWALVKAVRPKAHVEHWVWLTVLALAVVLPMHGTLWGRPLAPKPIDAVVSVELERAEIALMNERAAHVAQDVPRASRTEWWDGIREHSVVMSVAATRWVVGLYGATILLGALRFAWAWMAARRLVRRAREIVLPQEFEESVAMCGARMGTDAPRLLESSAISGPLVVGAMKPVMLLPVGFWEHTDDEVRAALLHELAHVRRRDYMVNMVCQVAALPVAWHPVVRAVEQRIRLTREMACDAMAAEQMRPGASYARCLVALARHTLTRQMLGADGRAQALGLFERGTMEERVMRLMEMDTTEKVEGRATALRMAAGVAAMLGVMITAAMFHVRPTFAATSAAVVETTGEVQGGSSSSGPVAASVARKTSAPAAAFQARLSEVSFQAQLSDVKMAAPVAPLQQEPGASGSATSADEDGPTATAGKGDTVHRWVGADGKKYVMVNRDPKEPTAGERLREEKNLSESLKQLDGLKFDDSQLKLQMDELKKSLADIDVKKQIDAAKLVMNGPEMKRQMAELRKQMNDPAWKKQMADAAKDAQLKGFESAEWQKQFAELDKNLASMHLEQELEMAKANLVKGQITVQMNDQMAKARKELESGELKAKLDAAQKMLDEVREQMEEMQKK